MKPCSVTGSISILPAGCVKRICDLRAVGTQSRLGSRSSGDLEPEVTDLWGRGWSLVKGEGLEPGDGEGAGAW